MIDGIRTYAALPSVLAYVSLARVSIALFADVSSISNSCLSCASNSLPFALYLCVSTAMPLTPAFFFASQMSALSEESLTSSPLSPTAVESKLDRLTTLLECVALDVKAQREVLKPTGSSRPPSVHQLGVWRCPSCAVRYRVDEEGTTLRPSREPENDEAEVCCFEDYLYMWGTSQTCRLAGGLVSLVYIVHCPDNPS